MISGLTDSFSGGGLAGELLARLDWRDRPLGPPARWPQSLRTALSIVLQVTPDPASTYKGVSALTVREDVVMFRYVCCSFLLLFVVPLLALVRSLAFEQRRWSESDHA